MCMAALLVGAIDYTYQNAIKVELLLKRIEKHHGDPGKQDHKTEVTERELNDYIGYRLAQEKRREITYLKVHLMDDNQVQGKIVLDARLLNLDLFFGEKLDIDFKGLLHSQRGSARLELSAVRLHGKPVSPRTLDTVFGAIALCYGTEPSRVDDWYPLPKGIDRVFVRKGKADLLY